MREQDMSRPPRWIDKHCHPYCKELDEQTDNEKPDANQEHDSEGFLTKGN